MQTGFTGQYAPHSLCSRSRDNAAVPRWVAPRPRRATDGEAGAGPDRAAGFVEPAAGGYLRRPLRRPQWSPVSFAEESNVLLSTYVRQPLLQRTLQSGTHRTPAQVWPSGHG